ncbi:MAG: tRNA (adenosine(37)-N6)-dimethylallyltransferase MiaA [Candidatus Calescibacterium sp.]|nr:tRNA (adenosine(37)-N6)-dimethylallyltransferase MiaA [Candidatus Calescibacterium sp.]MCX7972393.1 tRNA (adenosine(37)-N6)-dimethylallyltransferase MiaA [bacterium]MDW8195716.1 tRNA (adenosine(37)-N6)-dimethylallyltransferase MiaA [Candidatus Calescibacterium sp.]
MVIVITGPTAVGKTQLSICLSKKIKNLLIVSADSRQVYRFMDIGTDKVSKDIRKEIPHYLIDMINPDKDFSLFDFLRKSKVIIDFAINNRKNVIFVGGTILYILSLVKGYNLLPTNPEIRKKYEKMKYEDLKYLIYQLDKRFGTNFYQMYKDKRRIVRILEVVEITNKNPIELWKQSQYFPIDKTFILTDRREKIYRNIEDRVDKQIDRGLVDEVRFILKRFPDAPSFRSMKTFGYAEVIDYIQGKIDLESSVNLIKRNTRRFAKRQFSFIKKLQGEIINLDDFNNDIERVSEYICQRLN